MKRSFTIFMILILVYSMLVTVGLPAFAEGASDGGSAGDTFQDEIKETFGFDMEAELAKLKAWFDGSVAKVQQFLDQHKTIKTIIDFFVFAVAVLIVAPITLGLLIIAYVVVSLFIVFAGVLTAIIELVLGIIISLMPI